jgi:hypothetical protein
MTGMHIHVFGGHPSMNLTPRVAHLSACAPRVPIQPILLTAVRRSCVLHIPYISFHMGKRNHGAAIFYKVFTLDVKSCNELPNASLASAVRVGP